MEFSSIAENVKMTLEKSKQQTSIQNNKANIAMSQVTHLLSPCSKAEKIKEIGASLRSSYCFFFTLFWSVYRVSYNFLVGTGRRAGKEGRHIGPGEIFSTESLGVA